MCSLRDRILVRGYVIRSVRDKDGNLISVDSSGNMILTAGRETLAFLHSDSSKASDKVITQISWGNQGHNPANPAEPLSVLPEETALNNEILKKSISSYSYPGPTTVSYFARIEGAEIVNEIVSEAMLLSNDDTPFAIQRFGAMYHSAGLVFEFRWRIYF